jgi:hypothetical protein
VGPVLEDGTPFPTYFWLSCPYLIEEASRLESDGEVSAWAVRLAEDAVLAERMRAAEREYVALRDAAARSRTDGSGAADLRGFAGQRSVLATKCVHAHVAARLAGIDDPVGEAVLARTGSECADTRCSSFTPLEDGGTDA